MAQGRWKRENLYKSGQGHVCLGWRGQYAGLGADVDLSVFCQLSSWMQYSQTFFRLPVPK